MEASLSRRTYFIFFLISILLNLLILLFFMTQHMKHSRDKPIFFRPTQTVSVHSPKKMPRPVAPKPQVKSQPQPKPKPSPFSLASQSGAKADFVPATHKNQAQKVAPTADFEPKTESPQTSPSLPTPAQNTENQLKQEQSDTSSPHTTHASAQNQETNTAQIATQPKPLKQEATSLLSQQKQEPTQQSLAPKTTPLKKPQNLKHLNKQQPPALPKQNNILKKTDHLLHKSQAKTVPISKATAQKNMQKKSTSQPAQPPQKAQAHSSQKLTLAQLTKGFLNRLDQQPSAGSMKIVGKNNAQITEQQLKYENYAKKIIRCLQNSYQSNKHKAPFGRNNPPKIDIVMILDTKGLVKDTHILSSSGTPACNAFARSIFYDASDSLPPLPSWISPHETSFAWSDFFSLCQTPIEYIALSQK